MTSSECEVIDLFAGPGGWSEGLRSIGITELGLENDAAACATAEAAGHARLNVDIAATEPHDVTTYCQGLIGSPPCPGFSPAGKGLGRKDFDMLRAAIDAIASGRNPAHVLDDVRARQNDPRSALTLEPLRWALELEPEWIALEQVPTVLPLWEAYVPVLEADGYSVVVGNLHAEQYGVPQTRKRAVLMASRTVEASLPSPTHSRYYSHAPKKLDAGVEKWVSMAEALGWGMTDRPSMTVTGGGTSTGGAEPFGNAARKGMRRELQQGRWQFAGAGATARFTAGQIPRDLDQPAHTITGKGTAAWTPVDPSEATRNIRVTVEEAAILQSFRPDYPWQGKQGKRFQQVGNAVPPELAAQIVGNLAGLALEAVS